MATIKTSGLFNSDFNGGWNYDSGRDLNDFIFGNCGFGAISVAKQAFSVIDDVLGSVGNLEKILASLEISENGLSAVGFDNYYQLSVVGRNLGAFQEGGRGAATLTQLTANLYGASLTLTGSLTVNAQGLATGTIRSAVFDNGEDGKVELTGSIGIRNDAVTSASFTKAVLSDNDESATVTGRFSIGEDGPTGAISTFSFSVDGVSQLNVTGLRGLLIEDVLDDGRFNFEQILSGNDTISVVYGDLVKETVSIKRGGLWFLGEGSMDAVIEGYAGNDRLIGGDRDDLLIGGIGADRMSGGKGDDIYEVDNVHDSVIESRGQDSGFDTVLVQASETFTKYQMTANVEVAMVDVNLHEHIGLPIDIPFGTLGLEFPSSINVTITGNSGNNIIVGGFGSDTLNGGAGDDLLIGDSPEIYFPFLAFGGNDTLVGGAGNDVLIGLGGINTLTGGLGADLFVSQAGRVGVPGVGTDTITDFKVGVDKLVINTETLRFSNDFDESYDNLSIVGQVPLSTMALPFGETLFGQQLSALDFKVVQNFDADAAFTNSAIYFDSADGEVYFVEAYTYDADPTEGVDLVEDANVYLVATLNGVTNLRVSDIVLIENSLVGGFES